MKKVNITINRKTYLIVALFLLLGPLIKSLPLILFGEKTTAMSKTLNAHVTIRSRHAASTIYHSVVEFEANQNVYNVQLKTYVLYFPGETVELAYSSENPVDCIPLNFVGIFVNFDGVLFLLFFGLWSSYCFAARLLDFRVMSLTSKLFFIATLLLKGFILFVLLFVLLVLPFILYHIYGADVLQGWAAVCIPMVVIFGYYFSQSDDIKQFKKMFIPDKMIKE